MAGWRGHGPTREGGSSRTDVLLGLRRRGDADKPALASKS